MPNLNGTGPQGKGSLTGKRRGHCRNQAENSGKKPNENEEKVYGFGFGRKSRSGNQSGGCGKGFRGMGRGFRGK